MNYDAAIQDLRDERPVLLVGSLISSYPDTSLPTGGQITSELTDLLFPEHPTLPGEPSWSSWLRKRIAKLPFEAVIGSHPKAGAESTPDAIANLFGSERSNRIHEALAEALQAERISAVLTPNYDRTLDVLLSEEHDILVRHHEYECWLAGSAKRRSPLVKLHGSTEAPETLIFRMEQEKPWGEAHPKLRVLRRLLAGRSFIALGYSGADLDICPALVNTAETVHVAWVNPDCTEKLTANARLVLTSARRGLHIRCDLTRFLSKFLEEPGLEGLDPSGSPDVDLTYFAGPDDRRLWQLRVLARLGCALETLPPNYRPALTDPKEREIALTMLGHQGNYRDIAIARRDERRQGRRGTPGRVLSLVDESTAWLLYGSPLRSAWHMWNAKCAAAAFTGATHTEVQLTLDRRRFTRLMRSCQYADSFHFTKWLQALSDHGEQLLERLRDHYEDEGDWDTLRTLEHEAERMFILAERDYSLRPAEGYESVGMMSMTAITKRDEIRKSVHVRPWFLSSDMQLSAVQGADEAELYGWHHEAWKLYFILASRDRGPARCTWVFKWWEHFKQVQYPPLFRLKVLVAQLAPSRQTEAETRPPTVDVLECQHAVCRGI